MIYRARTGCQWNHLPKEFGSDSTVHRTVCRWDGRGVFDRLWAVLIYHCEELQAIHCEELQAAEGCLNKARFIDKKAAKADRARHRKAIRNQAVQKQTHLKLGPKAKTRAKASGQTPPTVANGASRKACWSRSEAAHFLSASSAQM